MTDARPAPGVLALAIERRQWELAAVCLALGVTRAARALPPQALEELIAILSVAPTPRARKRLRRR